MDEKELIRKLKKIKSLGFVKSQRNDDTGIGKTLEDLLGVDENNFKTPDLGEIELKAKRRDSVSMLTLATKQPEPKGAANKLFDNFKYKDKLGSLALHSTISGFAKNTQGFKLKLDKGKTKIRISNPKRITAYYPISMFNDVLVSKSDTIVLVFAESQGNRKKGKEKFHYVEAYRLSKLNKKKFVNAVIGGQVKVDLRIGSYKSGSKKGKFHDHGTAIRISKRDFLKLFDDYQQIL